MSKKQRPPISSSRRSRRIGNGSTSLALWPLLLTAVCLVTVTVAGVFLSPIRKTNAAAAQVENGISPEAMAQIEALINEKESRTGTQTKIDSQLIYELKMRNGQSVADGVQSVETDLSYTPRGAVELDIKGEISDSLLNQLMANGAQIITSVPGEKSVRVSVSIDRVESIAALPDVIFVQPKQEATTSQMDRPVDDTKPAKGFSRSPARSYVPPVDFAARAARVQWALMSALTGNAQGNVAGNIQPTGVGSRSSEADLTHRAFSARGAFHINGTGIK